MRVVLTLTGTLLLFAVTAAGEPEEGLVLHYAFDEGAGEVVRDKSGNGLDGRVVHARRSGVSQKAEWVREKDRKVLRFDGWTHVDAGTAPNAMMGQRGTLEVWCLPEEIGGGLISWNSVVENRAYSVSHRLVLGFFTYRTQQLLGMVADGVQCVRRGLHHTVEKGKWGHFVMTFGDGEPPSMQLYVNGDRVRVLPQTVSPNIEGVPLRIGRYVDGFMGIGFQGRMAEARVYNRVLSADEVSRRFIGGVKQLGVEAPTSIRVTPRLDARKAELTVLCDRVLVSNPPRRPLLSVLLRDSKKNVLQEKTVPLPPNADVVPVVLPSAALTAGLYEISAAVKDAETDKVVVGPTTVRWFFPEVAQTAGVPRGRKILNNLVTQLAVADNLALKPYQEVAFVNPRKGWVFFSATTQVPKRGLITIALDAEKTDAGVTCLSADKAAGEAMRLLSAGEHKLRIWFDAYSMSGIVPPAEKQATMTRLAVRAVPAMMYCGWPGGCHVSGYTEPWGGCYGFAFLKKDVLRNINTLVGVPAPRWDPDRAEWKRRGGQCLQEMCLPDKIRSVLKDAPKPLTGDYAYNYWAKSAGFTHPYFDGVMADEVSVGDNNPDFLAYTEAVKRLAANPEFKDKAVHMWGSATVMNTPSLSRDFARAVVDCGYKLAPNTYLSEAPTLEAARTRFDMLIRQPVERGAQACPGIQRHTIMNLFFSSAPPQTANINPHVDYKVFLDLQFQHLAVSPECSGLWGVMMYKATYAEEEAIRWAGRLFRHYCIEGATDLLSERYGFSYNLRHIRNGDFDEGLTGWQPAAAETASVKTASMRGLPSIFGRYHHANEGSNFLLMKRSARKPNRVSQDIVGLQPGRLYSMKMITADHQDLVQAKSVKKRLAVSVNIENVEMVPAKSFVSEVRSCAPAAQYAGKTPPFMNYRRLVFRAQAPTARLTLSDWTDETAPGGPVGQETLANFIEIQPYLED